MEIRNAANPKDVKNYDTDRLREEFHISKLFTKDNIRMVYSHIDRIITAGLMPVYQELKLEGGKELASDYFLERREMGCINVGGKGIITVDGTEYEMNPRTVSISVWETRKSALRVLMRKILQNSMFLPALLTHHTQSLRLI